MSHNSTPETSPIPPDLICGCGEPVKINLDRRWSLVGCLKCKTEVHFDDPEDAERVVRLIKNYWLAHGRPDYAGKATE